MGSFVDALQSDVLVADGAMGSLIARSLARSGPSAIGQALLAVNLEHPEIVQTMHLGYIAAGSRLITTNSFGASRARMERLGLGDRATELLSQAVKIAREAREASGKEVWIAGSISPLDADWLLDANPSRAQQIQQFQEQAETLLERGVDLVLLETYSRLDELLLAIEAVRLVSTSAPILASMSFDEHGELASGESSADAGRLLVQDGHVQAIGVNCSLGPQASLTVLEGMARVADLPLSIMPNAGFAQRVGGRVLYPDMSRQYYESFTRDALSLGARIIGGCCGTTPEQIHTIAETVALEREMPQTRAHRRPPVRAELVVEDLPTAMEDRPSGLLEKLRAGKFVRTLQIDPQRGPEDHLNRAVIEEILLHGQVDLVDINTSGAGGRQDSLQIAAGIERLGIETLPHISPRDASVAGILSQVLGAHAWAGVRNVLVIAGDPPRGDLYAEAKGVYQVDSIGLVRALALLRAGHRVNDRITMPPFSLAIGVALNQNAPHLGAELLRLQDKIRAGADFVMTQPFFDLESWLRFREQLEQRADIPVILGVWPLISLRQARRINENVAGVVVPESVCRLLEEAGPREREVGFELAANLIKALESSGSAAGVYVVAPFKQPRQALEIFRRPPTRNRSALVREAAKNRPS